MRGYGTDNTHKAQLTASEGAFLREIAISDFRFSSHIGIIKPMNESYVLYQTDICPFCAMVRRFLDTKGIELPTRNTQHEPGAREELIAGGGKATVPCLKITDESGAVQWMYESMDIMRYLDARVA